MDMLGAATASPFGPGWPPARPFGCPGLPYRRPWLWRQSSYSFGWEAVSSFGLCWSCFVYHYVYRRGGGWCHARACGFVDDVQRQVLIAAHFFLCFLIENPSGSEKACTISSFTTTTTRVRTDSCHVHRMAHQWAENYCWGCFALRSGRNSHNLLVGNDSIENKYLSRHCVERHGFAQAEWLECARIWSAIALATSERGGEQTSSHRKRRYPVAICAW